MKSFSEKYFVRIVLVENLEFCAKSVLKLRFFSICRRITIKIHCKQCINHIALVSTQKKLSKKPMQRMEKQF